jgi:putative peptidoglycan lipid II flippase
MRAPGFIKSNILITFLSLTGVGINFISQILIAYYFGAQNERDAYFSAMTVPTYVIALFVGSFSVVFLPFFVAFRKKHTESEVTRFVSSTIGVSFIFLAVLVVLGFMFSDDIVKYVAPGFQAEQLMLTGYLFRILIFTIIFQSLSSIVTVFHHVDRQFIWPAISPIVIPITSMIFVACFHNYGIKSLALGTLTGSLIAIVLISPVVLNKIRIKYLVDFLNPHTNRLIKLALPLFVTGIIYRLTTIIERIIASRLPTGSISYLGYSNQLYLLLATIASGSIITTFFPLLSSSWVEGNKEEFDALLCRGIGLILLITLPIAAVFIALDTQIIEILFQRGAFDRNATMAVARSLSLLMGAFIFGSLGNIMVKVFYIANKTFTISIINIVEIIIYAIAAYFLSIHYSYLGLAFALTLSTGFTIFVSAFFLLRWNFLSISNFSLDLVKLLVAAFCCGVLSYFMFSFLDGFNIVIATVFSGLTGVLFYLVIILCVLRVKDANVIYKAVVNYF